MLCRLIVSSSKGQQEVVEGNAVVFAVGVKAMQGIVSGSPDLAACPVGTYPPVLCTLALWQVVLLVQYACCPKVVFAGSVLPA